MLDLNLPTAGYIAGFVAAGGLAMKYLPPLFRSGDKENNQGEWRGRVQSLLESNVQLCQQTSQLVTILSADVRHLNDLVQEIERRTRDAEEGFREVHDVADMFQSMSAAIVTRASERTAPK
jgi:hypothetical protein